MAPRIKVPADAVRTPEQILAGVTIRGEYVWLECWNCGGSGNYPSSMIPAGRCRLYCFQNRTPDTYGKLPVLVAKYVKREQASDRADYRARIRYEQDAPNRAAREAAAAESERVARQAEEVRLADEAARLAVSQWVGRVGDKIACGVTLVDWRSFDSTYGRRTMYRLRDDAGNVLVWWTTGALDMGKGDRCSIKATVKEHTEYRGERQTVLLRAKTLAAPGKIGQRDMTAWEKKLCHLEPKA